MEFNNQDIELIRRGNNLEHKNYMKKNPWYIRWFCCYPYETIDIKLFLKDSYEKFGLIIDHDSMISSSASSYDKYDHNHDHVHTHINDNISVNKNKNIHDHENDHEHDHNQPIKNTFVNNGHYFDDYNGVCQEYKGKRKYKSIKIYRFGYYVSISCTCSI